jgi:hypothetical protein
MGVEARDGEGEDEVQHVDYSFRDCVAVVGRSGQCMGYTLACKIPKSAQRLFVKVSVSFAIELTKRRSWAASSLDFDLAMCIQKLET